MELDEQKMIEYSGLKRGKGIETIGWKKKFKFKENSSQSQFESGPGELAFIYFEPT